LFLLRLVAGRLSGGKTIEIGTGNLSVRQAGAVIATITVVLTDFARALGATLSFGNNGDLTLFALGYDATNRRTIGFLFRTLWNTLPEASPVGTIHAAIIEALAVVATVIVLARGTGLTRALRAALSFGNNGNLTIFAFGSETTDGRAVRTFIIIIIVVVTIAIRLDTNGTALIGRDQGNAQSQPFAIGRRGTTHQAAILGWSNAFGFQPRKARALGTSGGPRVGAFARVATVGGKVTAGTRIARYFLVHLGMTFGLLDIVRTASSHGANGKPIGLTSTFVATVIVGTAGTSVAGNFPILVAARPFHHHHIHHHHHFLFVHHHHHTLLLVETANALAHDEQRQQGQQNQFHYHRGDHPCLDCCRFGCFEPTLCWEMV